MSRIVHITNALLIIVFVSMSCSRKERAPNIVVLLVDDAGYADFGFMGSKDLKTPNIDKLAKNGMVFTDAHVSATVCSPSRAGFLTGKYQQRFGFECNALNNFKGIDSAETTIASMLKSAGYSTGFFGKWHVGDIRESRPNHRGFDYSYGFLAGGRSYFHNDWQDVKGNLRSIRENDRFTTFMGYLTDVLGEKAVEFIDRKKEKPFFIYWSPNAVHTPMEATMEDLKKFENHPRQTLAAMTWSLDRAVGSIIDKLETENLLDNTLIFFLSDNGGAHDNQSYNTPLKGFKGNKYEGGHRVAFLAHWPDKIKKGKTFDGLTSSLDVYATAVEVSKVKIPKNQVLDGISLVPYFTGKKVDAPHDKLFWRKEGMAAVRDGNHKLIRVDSLGDRLYNLKEDLGEMKDISKSDTIQLQRMQAQLQDWEERLMDPLWLESKAWNEVTWWIHHDLFENVEVRAKSPQELKKIKDL